MEGSNLGAISGHFSPLQAGLQNILQKIQIYNKSYPRKPISTVDQNYINAFFEIWFRVF